MPDLDILSLGINLPEAPENRFSLPFEILSHLQILIRGIALHAIEGDPQDLKELQRRLSGIADSLTVNSSPDDLLVGIGKTLRALEEYNRRAAAIFKGQVEELRSMLSTMTATIMFITSSSETSVKQLSVIESKLQRVNSLEDTRQVKSLFERMSDAGAQRKRAAANRNQDQDQHSQRRCRTAVTPPESGVDGGLARPGHRAARPRSGRGSDCHENCGR